MGVFACAGPHPDTDNIMDPKPAEGEEQAKKRRGRKKSKLEDMFPAYLQVRSLSLSMFDLGVLFLITADGHAPAVAAGGVLWEGADRLE